MMMTWHLEPVNHQRSWHWLCLMNGSLSGTRNYFNHKRRLYNVKLGFRTIIPIWRSAVISMSTTDRKSTYVFIAMTTQWAQERLKSPVPRLFTQSFMQTQIKENIKAPRCWPFCEEFTGVRWIPRANGQLRGNVFIWWRHYVIETAQNDKFRLSTSVSQIFAQRWNCSLS